MKDGISEKTGTKKSEDGRPGGSATITAQSKPARASPIPRNAPCIPLGRGKSETRTDPQEIPRIDWNGVLPAFITTAPLWAAPLMSVRKKDGKFDSKRLAEITGLWFPMKQENGDERK
ncbi:MAG: hypothetical protein LBI87_00275 [Candidatus Accumulibacter sp.]|jgi:hypothetical protein|nr:hypothetical protein [Accumulibacter sp.]